MSYVRKRASAFWQLSRPDPAASWAGGAFLVGSAAAIYHAGLGINYVDGAIALVGVLLAISIAAHGLNDVYDWLTGTDKESIGKGTGGTRVIPQGKFSVPGLLLTAIAALALVASIGVFFYIKYGLPILILTLVAVGAPIVYSLPPFKLAYRPFPELILVVPTLTGVAIGTELVLSGFITPLSVILGLLHSFFCISWYMISRIPDYDPDRGVGKVTTVVYLGREKAPIIAAVYLTLALVTVPVGMLVYTPAIALTLVFYPVLLWGIFQVDPYDPEQASGMRMRQIRLTTVHAAALAVAVAAAGV